jgi:hypothetical protein
MADNKLNTAIAKAKTGDKDLACQLLSEYLRENPSSETGWLWLYACIETVEQKRYCLNQAIKLNPNNEDTRKALTLIDNRISAENNVNSAESVSSPSQSLSKSEPCPKCGKLRQANEPFCASCTYSFSKERDVNKPKSVLQAKSLLIIGTPVFALLFCFVTSCILLIGIESVTGDNRISNFITNVVSFIFIVVVNIIFGLGTLFVFFAAVAGIVGIGYLIWTKRETIKSWVKTIQQTTASNPSSPDKSAPATDSEQLPLQNMYDKREVAQDVGKNQNATEAQSTQPISSKTTKKLESKVSNKDISSKGGVPNIVFYLIGAGVISCVVFIIPWGSILNAIGALFQFALYLLLFPLIAPLAMMLVFGLGSLVFPPAMAGVNLALWLMQQKWWWFPVGHIVGIILALFGVTGL